MHPKKHRTAKGLHPKKSKGLHRNGIQAKKVKDCSAGTAKTP
jgi:hypothetical protein